MPDTTVSHTLVLLRHAKAEATPSSGSGDAARRLAPRGRADAAAVGRWFVEVELGFDLVVCSPSARTRETWDVVAAAGVAAAEVRHDDRVYDASVDDLLDVLADVPDAVERVLVVGHAPGIPELVELLADPDISDGEALTSARRAFPTSCFAVLEIEDGWAELAEQSAVLSEVAAPRG